MKPIRVLLVDDDEDILNVLGILFEMDGHTVQFANTYNTALALVEKEPFDIVVTDYRMPGMHGLYLLLMIKDVQPDMPVIIMTAYKTDKMEEEARRKRVDDIITKPFEYEALIGLMEKHVGARR